MEDNIDTFMALLPDSRIRSKPVVMQILIHKLQFMMHRQELPLLIMMTSVDYNLKLRSYQMVTQYVF